MSQEPVSQETTSNEALSDDQLDNVAGGVLYSLNDDMDGYTGESTTSTTTTTTNSTSYTSPQKITEPKPIKSTWG
jgi:hypothetical protein